MLYYLLRIKISRLLIHIRNRLIDNSIGILPNETDYKNLIIGNDRRAVF